MNPPLPGGPSRGGRDATYQPPPPTRFRPGVPISRPPGLRPLGPRPPGLRPPGLRPPGPRPLGPRPLGPRPSGPPRSSYPPQEYPPQEYAPRLPAARGYPPEQRRPTMAATDPYYQRYPGYSRGHDYYHPTASSTTTTSSSSIETRAVINYDHQSLTKDADDNYGAKATTSAESSVAKNEPDHYRKRAAGYEEERRVSVERSQNSTATDGEDATISGINIDLVKAAIVSHLLPS